MERINKKDAEKYRDAVYQYYILENLSYDAGAKKIGMPSSVFRRLCNKFCFVKNKEQINNSRATTNIEKYGVENPFGNDDIKEKIRKTNTDKYGVPYAIMNNNVKKKAIETLKTNHGCENPDYVNWSDEAKYTIDHPEIARSFIVEHNFKNAYDVAKYLGISVVTVYRWSHKAGVEDLLDCYTSRYESELRDILSSWGVTCYKSKSKIAPYEIDLYCPDYNVGIEFNGNLYHSFVEDGAPHCEGKDKKYHFDKSEKAKNKGIFLFHIFEYEWADDRKRLCIISQLKNIFHKNENRIYARKCTIKEVGVKEKNEFLDKNHRQGSDFSSVNIGLFYEDRLVSIMTFAKPRFSKKYDWELSRFCSENGTSVIGGASKLFLYFIKNYFGTIVSYSDIAKTSGDIYSKLGFELSHISDPGYVWCNSSNKILSRYQCQMKNEVVNMQNDGYWRIFDCGCCVWVYKK